MTSSALAAFVAAGVVLPGDAAIATRLAQLVGDFDPRGELAVAMCLQALRTGSVCVDLRLVATQSYEQDEQTVASSDLPWPDAAGWISYLQTSPLVSLGEDASPVRPLRFVEDLLYLERYWAHEEAVRRHLHLLLGAGEPADDGANDAVEHALDERFDGAGLEPDEPDHQRAAAAHAVSHRLTIIAGGPGTGKTSTVARLLAVVLDVADSTGQRSPRIALAAPTGKAAVRLEESLHHELRGLPERFRALDHLTASTIHRLLGWVPTSSSRFIHDATDPLPYDVVVVDEASMVSLTLMRRLLDALRPSARLILVGDPDQLSPVEAGAVLADVVRAPAFRAATVELTRNWRFGSDIAELADAVRSGRADTAVDLLTAGREGAPLEFIPVDPAAAQDTHLAGLRARTCTVGRRMLAAAQTGDAVGAIAALDAHRVLCAHRSGAWGIQRWAWQAEQWLNEVSPGFGGEDWYVGRPILINRNLRDVQLFNGDSGVIVRTSDGPRAAVDRGGEPRLFAPSQLADVTTLLAMTVHKSQGSQFEHVTVVLPEPESPLLTRELLYTAITRAKDHVTVIGTHQAVRAAVERPAARASGLRRRLGRV